MTFDEKLTTLTNKCKSYIRTGQISMYSSTLKEMAILFRENEYTKDQLRVLILSFYIDLSGFSRASFIDRSLIQQLQTTLQENSIDVDVLEKMFFEWVHSDIIPQHALGLKDCWYLLRLCAEDKIEQAEYILTRI